MLYNNFSSPLYTGRAGTMVMRTVSLGDEFPRRRADNVHDRTVHVDQPFDSESTGSSEDTDLIPIHSGEDWVAQLDDDLSQPTAISSDSFRISALQKEDPVCITLHSWISSAEFPSWIEVKGLSPEIRLLWHHRNNLSVDDNGIIWRKRSTESHLMQLLVPKPGREQLFLSYHASLFGGHLGRNRTLARLAHRKRSYYDSVCLWLYIATRVGSLRMDS